MTSDLPSRQMDRFELPAAPEEGQFREAVESLPVVVYIALADPAERIIYISSGIERLLGTSPQDWLRDSQLWLQMLHGDDAGRVLHEQAQARATGQPFRSEYRLVTRRGETVWVEHQTRPMAGTDGAPLLLGMMQDITSRRKVEDRLRGLAYLDELTGLLNRRGFIHSVEQQMTLSRRTGRSAILLYLDVDGLKAINEELGRSAGDQAIEDVAGILRGCLRSTDILARNEGDEFLAWAVETSGDSSEILRSRLQRSIRELNARSARPYQLSVSIGTAYFEPGSDAAPSDVLREAERDMYERKRQGEELAR